MTRWIHRPFFAAFCLLFAMSAHGQAQDEAFAKVVKPFLTQHCVKCHGSMKTSGDVRLDELSEDMGKHAERWLAARDQIRDGLMPPAKEARPDPHAVRGVLVWIAAKTGARPAKAPNHGNHIPHELLFGKPAEGDAAGSRRLWRLSPDGYEGYVQALTRTSTTKSVPGFIQPFTYTGDRGIQDFSALFTVDASNTEVLVRNAAAIVEIQLGPKSSTNFTDQLALYKTASPTEAQIEAAVQAQHRLAIGRRVGPEDLARYVALYHRCAKDGDHAGAVKTVMQAVILRADAIFRAELGEGARDGKGRAMLSPVELAKALSLSLGNRIDPGLQAAADAGNLKSRQEVAAQIDRMLKEPKVDRSRILKFFHEYFEYHKALEVFKEKPKDFNHNPAILVNDTNQLVMHILAEDRDVFRQLLTTDKSFVNHVMKKDKGSSTETAQPADVANNNNKGKKQVHHVYGYEDWPSPQPVTLPEKTRIGVLMQPSWLVAWGTNFDNDPVRRGRWVRERLLGGVVPDLPIGVAAMVPEDPHRTFRDRLTVTRQAQCWKCHQKMDDLGLPFEQFDHFGRYRTTEEVADKDAPPRKLGNKILGPGTKQVPLDTTGLVADSGNPRLDGTIRDPRELVRKLADSDQCRQVFIRHVFRFFLGRNETLADAATLQEADRVYLATGGSFKAMLVSLLTSDSFLYRTLSVASNSNESGDRK